MRGLPDIRQASNGAVLRYNAFPENFIKANPQFNNATLLNNLGKRITIRFSANHDTAMPGISDMQASYTWSKLLGRSGRIHESRDRAADYTIPNRRIPP
jgi:hypothetical protein